MPVIQRKGAQSSQGFGEFAQSSTAAANYIEDYFSTYLYTGNGTTQAISNGIGLADTAAWSSYKLQQNNSIGYGVTTDSSGNFYVTGYANDGTTLYTIVAKYNSSGTIQWQRKLQQNNSLGKGIITDASGNVYVSGRGNDGSFYIIIAKYNSSGTIQWQRKLRQNASEGTGIAIDSSGNIYITGGANDGTNDYIIVAKYDSSGVIQWKRKLQQNGSYGYGITTDTSGNVYVVGRANDGTNNYIIVAKYNSSGTIQWQRKLKQNNSLGGGITTDASGNVYVSGYANDGTNYYIIVAKYDSSGVIQWQRKLQQNSSFGTGIATDTSGNVYVTGYPDDGTNIYIIVAKYDSSGVIQWQRKLQQNGSFGSGITADSSGNVYVTGYANDGTNNYFVTSKLKQDGTTTSGTAFVTMVSGTATDSAGTATDSAAGATDSAAGATDSAGTATDSAGTATATSATQAAVTGGGGLVWIKDRSAARSNALFDTARGATYRLITNAASAQSNEVTALGGFNSNGFSTGYKPEVNQSGETYVSWTFRKQAKFFDIVTYTGNGANRTISHNLGSVPGCIMIKRTDTIAAWAVYHSSLANTEYLVLNTTAAKATGATYWNSTTPTSTVFSLGTSTNVNANGGTYVAYLFANNAGGFGATGTDNVISCGSYAGNNGLQEVNLGYEAQWVLIKNANGAYNWSIYDNMRGMAVGAVNNPVLYPNTADAEAADRPVYPTSTGFAVNTAANIVNATGNTYIYIAIRRGPMKTPTSGTSVFSPVARTGTGVPATITSPGFAPDLIIDADRPAIQSGGKWWFDRLRSPSVVFSSTSTNAESSAYSNSITAMTNTGYAIGADTNNIINFSGETYINWVFQRAPGFMDVVCYTGTGSSTTQTHNLGVVPELIMVKRRENAGAWAVYSSALSNTEYLVLNTTAAKATGTNYWNSTTPTSSVFSIGTATDVNASGGTYISYLFATVAGVSKVGSYTGTGALQTVNCGFTSGARFVLIKRTDSTGDWYVWDSARGISSGNDPYLLLNSTASEVTGTNYVDTDTTGFKVTAAAPAGINANGGSYLFLAIA